MPPLPLITIIYCFAIAAVFANGGLIDFSTFDDVNGWSFLIASLALAFTSSLVAPMISAWLIYNSEGTILHLSTIIITIAMSTYLLIKELAADMQRIAHMDFGINIIPSAINWAIFIDITYSLYFLVPGFLLVAAQRWSFGRRMFLNLILLVADHPKGALYGIANILMAWITEITKFLKRGTP
jgi:hypothetical protein